MPPQMVHRGMELNSNYRVDVSNFFPGAEGHGIQQTADANGYFGLLVKMPQENQNAHQASGQFANTRNDMVSAAFQEFVDHFGTVVIDSYQKLRECFPQTDILFSAEKKQREDLAYVDDPNDKHTTADPYCDDVLHRDRWQMSGAWYPSENTEPRSARTAFITTNQIRSEFDNILFAPTISRGLKNYIPLSQWRSHARLKITDPENARVQSRKIIEATDSLVIEYHPDTVIFFSNTACLHCRYPGDPRGDSQRTVLFECPSQATPNL